MDLNKEQLENIIEGYQADFTDGFEQTRKAIYVEDVPMMIKEALALAEKSKHTSIKEIFGMESAYKEASPDPFGNMYISKGLVVDMVDYIKNLESLAEKSRWKYPDKGELPEDGRKVVFYLTDGECLEGHFKSNRFHRFVDILIYKTSAVNCWTYAPVLED